MNSIQIGSSVVRIAINDDPDRVIEFDPGDVLFAERFYALIQDFERRQAEMEQRAAEIDQVKDVDANGLPVNLDERMAFLRSVCEYMRSQIDNLFGAGSSQIVFGDALNLEQIGQFFDGMTPFVQQSRAEKLKKYEAAKKAPGRRVMK